MKKKIKTHENNLKRTKEKSDKLDSSTKEVKGILNNTKVKGFNKNQYVISLKEKEKIDEFVKQVDNTNKEYQKIQFWNKEYATEFLKAVIKIFI